MRTLSISTTHFVNRLRKYLVNNSDINFSISQQDLEQDGGNMMGVRKPSLEIPSPPTPGEEVKQSKLSILKRDIKVI